MSLERALEHRGGRAMTRLWLGLLILGLTAARCAAQTTPEEAAATPGTGEMTAGVPAIPPVKALMEGEEIFFLHTEASAPQVADMLTDMIGSPVLVVPSLAQAPEAMLASVYVFQNGLEGEGPFGFQLDVFDNPPGTEGYSPLRRLNLVTWQNEGAARTPSGSAGRRLGLGSSS